MLVKICGITNEEDALTAVAEGADFIGLIFVPASKRYLTIERAKEILAAVDDTLRVVGLFQNESIETVVKTVETLGLKIVQLHGEESPTYIKELASRLPHCRFIKAVTIRGPEDLDGIRVYNGEKILAVLLDGPGGGGAGLAFDWRAVGGALAKIRSELPPIFLAGGLRPENVVEGIAQMKPDGVDVSSGVEAKPGKKDPNKIRTFTSLAKGCG
jgi:phosphoribosylanthranilate isomerase